MVESEQQQKGLYTPSLEKDACGVGLIADLSNKASHYILDASLTMLERMEHRGACGCEENTGDGAGVLTQIPYRFFYNLFLQNNIEIPERGKYGVGMFFFPNNPNDIQKCKNIIEAVAQELDFKIIFQRIVPTKNTELGASALNTEPSIQQIFFKPSGFRYNNLEKRFYFLRSVIMSRIYYSIPRLRDDFYIASLSTKTIVYKGLLTANQLRNYFLDLKNPQFETAVAIIHSRFSTNTLPKWKLAQPFRCIAHNGEINTIQGNLNWWNAREKHIGINADLAEFRKVFPICDPFLSDSGNFDNVVEFLMQASRSIPHSVMMMIPEAWQNDTNMPAYKKAFYQYHDAVIEPWDGPASICFTDGTLVGATLDRNGLRPSRYLVTSDNLLVLASETGCVDIDPTTIVKKGRLEPGKMLVADLDEKRIITDKELKEVICKRKPYAEWLNENAKILDDLPETKENILDETVLTFAQKQILHGITTEDEEVIIKAMFKNQKEAVGSMGLDIPLAILSKQNQHIANYFKQQFAQVTNPPIDSIREKFFMSLSTVIGGGSKIVGTDETQSKVIRFKHPFLLENELNKLLQYKTNQFNAVKVNALYAANEKLKLKNVIKQKCEEIEQLIYQDKNIFCFTDRNANENQIPIPSVMLIGAVHHFLIEKGLRKEVTLIADCGDIWETHHTALLFAYGADLVCPYLALQTVEKLNKQAENTIENPTKKYIKALKKGLLKIMSKLGVSTLSSYRGAQTFEALGIAKEVINVCFKGTISRIGGLKFSDLQKENELKHKKAFENNNLNHEGVFQWRKKGEYHLFNPQTIHLLQHSTSSGNYETYLKFASEIDKLETNNSTLRSFLRIKENENKPIPIEQVESTKSIMKRFASGAMSFGSISHEAHTTLAMAMNRIGGKSNSGEGGEDSARYPKLPNGDWQRSAIKQVASGRFGVNIHYLTNANELQIKMAQGAKPGEGGQLPGHKVDANIARVRNSTEGVGLISPPPHHDIYSIEDLAQLIFDLKNANRKARISVKLVAKTGVGVIASGVAKAHADHILISGCDGGTGASPLSSIRHAGLPWEIGLSETHQTLVKNGLRDRVVLQTDGQIRTGRDMAIATILGAEEWGIATAALVVEGCILMRKCHLNTCPVGIATQDKSLREKFNGKVEHLVNYFQFLAQHLREIMASVGVKTVNELVGRTDLIEIIGLNKHWKSKNLKLKTLLHQEYHPNNKTVYCSTKQNHNIESVLDKKLIEKSQNALQKGEQFNATIQIKNTDRAVGAMLSNTVSEKFGEEALAPKTLNFNFKGSCGQSFGAFAVKGVYFNVEGDANDYFGKGLSGAILSIKPYEQIKFDASKNVIVGNVALYGATSGEAYINGMAGDRFCVRNSGATAVVEGTGENACEYMTGGTAIVLGKIGRNFGAGMSGGVAYLYMHQATNNNLINQEMLLLETPSEEDLSKLKQNIQAHFNYTTSKTAQSILKEWEASKNRFIKIIPKEYKRIIEAQKNQKPQVSDL